MLRIKTIGLALAVGALISSVEASPVIAQPVVMPEAMLSITVPDLQGFIDGIGSVAEKVSPMMNGMMLKNMMGMQLGDPGLGGFVPGKGFAVVALNATNFFGVLEVTEAQSALYAKVLSAQGMQTTYTNGVLVVGQSPEMISKGTAHYASVKSTLLAKRSPTLRITAQPTAVIERNNEPIQKFLTLLPTLMGGSMDQTSGADAKEIKMASTIIEAELRVLLSIARQCESGEVVVAPSNGSIQLSETYAPAAGSRLAKLMDATKTVKANPKIQSGLLSDGMLQLDFVVNSPEAITDFIVAEMNQLVKDMPSTNIDVTAVSAALGKWMDLYGGTACETFDFDSDDGLSVNYLLEISDEAKTLQAFKTMKQDIKPMLGIYQSMGMKMDLEFKEKVEEYKGIKINRMVMRVDMDEMSEEQQKQMEALDMEDMEYDVAIFDGLLLCTMGDNAIHKAIDRIKDPATAIKPLAARSVYPSGGFYYGDFDIGRYLEMLSAFMPEGENPLPPELIAMMQGVDPVTSAAFRQDGLVMWSVNIPGDMIGKIGQISMMMQMQKMQQQQGAPKGMPQAMPAPVQ